MFIVWNVCVGCLWANSQTVSNSRTELDVSTATVWASAEARATTLEISSGWAKTPTSYWSRNTKIILYPFVSAADTFRCRFPRRSTYHSEEGNEDQETHFDMIYWSVWELCDGLTSGYRGFYTHWQKFQNMFIIGCVLLYFQVLSHSNKHQPYFCMHEYSGAHQPWWCINRKCRDTLTLTSERAAASIRNADYLTDNRRWRRILCEKTPTKSLVRALSHSLHTAVFSAFFQMVANSHGQKKNSRRFCVCAARCAACLHCDANEKVGKPHIRMAAWHLYKCHAHMTQTSCGHANHSVACASVSCKCVSVCGADFCVCH